MEFYVEISTRDINRKPIIFRLQYSANTSDDQTLILSSSRLQIVGTCQPPTEDLGEFSDEDEYEASVPIRLSHQDKEYDNVGEDVVEEELANFYSQVDVERARGFPGDFGPRSEDVEEFYEGMKFPTKAALRRHVKLYHIKNNCTFVVAKSGSNFEDWRCPKSGKECAWRLRATQKVNTYHWEITICPEKYKCVTMTLSQDHPKLDYDMIASFIISMVTLEPDISVASIIERINTQFNFEVSHKKAWLAKHKAITRVLDTSIRIFQKVFWAYKPCIDAFAHLKPMVQVDGTFLYGKYTQTLLIASSQDDNSNVVPHAFAIAEGETLEAWEWFLKRVCLHVVGDRENTCLISDRHLAILSAVSDPRTMWQPPYCHHVYCIRHLASNLNKKYRDSNLKDLFINIDVNSLYVGITIVCQNVFYDADIAQRTIQNFHHNQFSMSLSKQDSIGDVVLLLGLPCVVVPIVGRTDLPWATICEGLLGQTPPEGKLKGQRLSMKWLDDMFSFANFPPNPTVVDMEHFARAYILKLIGPNYLTWSIAMKTSLEVKDKLPFITITPLKDKKEFRRWKKVDSMVKSWVRNSVCKDIADTLIKCASTKCLWDELEDRYGARSGPQLYKIQTELSPVQQGTNSITTYYYKLYKAWDELDKIAPLPTCRCTKCTYVFSTKLKDMTSSTRVLQFLMGLNPEYETIRGQILNLEPLPSVSKVFNMVARVESEKNVSMTFASPRVEASALLAKGPQFTNESGNKSLGKKKDFVKKGDRFCDHCNISGHTKESCFKVHGYPEWYKELKDAKKNGGNKKAVANMAGDASIQDIGASSHMSSSLNTMQHVESIIPPIKVHFPDSNSKVVTQKGQVVLHPKLTLKIVFYLPSFKYNLLSVNKLIKESDLYLIFHKSHCIVQDLTSKEVIAVVEVRKNLYILETKSFYPDIMPYSKLLEVYALRPITCPIKINSLQGPTNVFSFGYVSGQKAYKAYNLDTHKILISRDVKFYEAIFRFASDSNTKSVPLPILVNLDDSDETVSNNNLEQLHNPVDFRYDTIFDEDHTNTQPSF
ncbi:uncharacterized protein G2W53_041069 [Senna tora]|uniref:Uncharacterized protein n=1 Tax=Senna tora TaxID=362788 RepID=A0A834SGT2_9FABA|nr:uncharacterized protein G2W53_041069 [Senna tora]